MNTEQFNSCYDVYKWTPSHYQISKSPSIDLLRNYLLDNTNKKVESLSICVTDNDEFITDFLNEFPKITKLTLFGRKRDPNELNINKLKYVKSYVDNIYESYLEYEKTPHISYLNSLKNIERLAISYKYFNEILELKQLVSLHISRRINEDKEVKLDGIEGLQNLTELHIPDLALWDKSVIAKLSKLEILSMYAIEPEKDDNKFLQKCKKLKNLDVFFACHFDPEVLRDNKTLEKLKLSTIRNVTDLRAIGTISSLETLDLDLCGMDINDISFLRNNINLRHLTLFFGRKLEDNIPLENLKLETLELSCCNIKDWTPLKNIKTLKCLDIGCNPVKNFKAGLSNHQSLERIRMENTDDLSEALLDKWRMEKLGTDNIVTVLETLKTIPNLKIFSGNIVHGIPIELKQNFAKTKPHVGVADYCDWKNCSGKLYHY